LKSWKRWLLGLGLAVGVLGAARPLWEMLLFAIEDPLSHQGATLVSFMNERGDDVSILAFKLGDTEGMSEDKSEKGHRISPFSPSHKNLLLLLSAPSGRQPAEFRYRVGDSPEIRTYRFELDLIPQSQCDTVIQFDQNGPRASACQNHRPASYGGTWRH